MLQDVCVTFLCCLCRLTNEKKKKKPVCEVCGGTYRGMEASSFIHGQEPVTVDPFDADDPLRNCKELQDTWVDKQHGLTTDGRRKCIFTSLVIFWNSLMHCSL